MDINKLAGDVVHRWRQRQATDKELKRAIVRVIRLALRQNERENGTPQSVSSPKDKIGTDED